MNDAARRTLVLVAELLASAVDEWWIIAGAALALHGVGGEPNDIDVLLSERDARLVLSRLGLPAEPGVPDDRFRSRLFARWTATPLPVELMAGLEVHALGAWIPVTPQSREPFEVDGTRLFAPGLDDVRRQLRLFGRAKDLRRAVALGD